MCNTVHYVECTEMGLADVLYAMQCSRSAMSIYDNLNLKYLRFFR